MPLPGTLAAEIAALRTTVRTIDLMNAAYEGRNAAASLQNLRVEGGTKSGHPTAADQGPQRLILGVTRVTVRVSLLAVFALPGLQPLAAAVA
jgi:hypothetical protein